ncbi:MAG TPA: hypothetical protein VLF69_04845 [Candidatus Saccharimonadales bacterium]|nr:hypothetical protein [Candidatus Saccharimonadales bacterium]
MADIVVRKFGGSGKQRWVWTALIVAVVLVAGAAGVGLRYIQSRHQVTPGVTRPQQTKASRAQDIALNGDYPDAQKQIADALKQPGLSANERYQLYYQQGANDQNQGNNQAALDSFKLAAAVKQTESLYESMAMVAQALGDNASAINYYKQAIKLIQPSPLADEYKNADEQAIKSLGGQP